ncbi:hypothetical protein ACLOAU_16385 [Niabella sp. CJ426]|uniref:hypothetical protein n=1 Tax=Niabella sp. CJ426 TaxID=3393740 RepID=UPI003D06E916
MKNWMTLLFFAAVLLFSCDKDDNVNNVSQTKRDYLMAKTWTYDTLNTYPLSVYENLELNEYYAYVETDRSLVGAQIHFKTSGQVTVTLPSLPTETFDWRLVNNDNDIEISQGTDKDTLRSFDANASRFSYLQWTNGKYFATYKWK